MRLSIFAHYFRRAFSYPLYLAIFVGVPLGIIALNAVAGAGAGAYGFNANASVAAIMMVLGFQFFNTGMVSHFLYLDTKVPMRNRLAAAPCGMSVFVFSAIAANMAYALLAGLAVVGAASLLFDIHWGNPLVFGGALALFCVIGAMLSILLFLLIEEQRKSDAAHMLISFGMFIVVNIGLSVQFENETLRGIIDNSNPLSIGLRAVMHSGRMYGGPDGMEKALAGMLALAALAAVMGAAVAVAARRRAK